MSLGHERLDVYQLSLEYVRFIYDICKGLKGECRHARDQILRSSQSIPQNIAEGNGKTTENDRRRYFEIARGSALESAATQDILEICNAISNEDSKKGKVMIGRMVAMLIKLGGRGFKVTEVSEDYEIE